MHKIHKHAICASCVRAEKGSVVLLSHYTLLVLLSLHKPPLIHLVLQL